nr:NADH dehydrogenase subunit 6 [Membranacea stenoprocessa]
MKFLVSKIMMIISLIIPMLNNPMSMGLFLLIQTFMAIIYLNLILSYSWFMMITFLMLIGGLLILIMYMNSISSNTMFKFKINLTLFLMIMLILTDEMISDFIMNENEKLSESTKLGFNFIKIYNFKSMYIIIMMVIYLLLTMISISKCVKFFDGPLRSFNYE